MKRTRETYLLMETAAGYILFLLKEWDTIAQSLQTAQQAYLEYSKFSKVVETKGLYLFPDAETALSACQAISSGEADDILKNFLYQNLPSKQSAYNLACLGGLSTTGAIILHLDPGLGKNLSQCSFPIIYDKNILEVTRLCRFHLRKLVREFKDKNLIKFQVGLGHSYLRTKLNLDVNRQDKPVQNAIAILDNIDKALNTFAMRAKEWYGWHFPELAKIVTDTLVRDIGARDDFTKDKVEMIAEILDGDVAMAKEILAAKDISMGQELTSADMLHIRDFAVQVVELAHQRQQLASYLGNKLEQVAPNLQVLLGSTLAAKLIAHSGSLSNLAKCPASTVQILGAEKALFRALKTKGKTPKYGLLFQSSFIGRTGLKNKGRISRYLANKCSLAARIDNFSDVPTSVFGEKMKHQVTHLWFCPITGYQVESRMQYLADGIAPKRNIDSMKEAYALYKAELAKRIPKVSQTSEPSEPKSKKKRKHREAVKQAVQGDGKRESKRRKTKDTKTEAVKEEGHKSRKTHKVEKNRA